MADSEWKALIEDVDGRGQLTEQRKRIIDRLVRERVEYEFLYPTVAEQGAIKEGPNGGDVFNFHWSALQKIKDQITKLEEQLKIPVERAAPAGAPKPAQTKADKFLERLGPH
ncbi:P27 family phage terminase small subunit [Roseovarius indicus]|nr:P27 family phage terminase small subunit [Roseovarius indicus]